MTLIAGPAGRRAVFPNEKRELSAGWQAAQKTEGRPAGCIKSQSSGLRKRAGRAAEKARLFPLPSLMCRPPARLNVQPTGPPFCAAHQPVENSCFSFGNTALQPARPSV